MHDEDKPAPARASGARSVLSIVVRCLPLRAGLVRLVHSTTHFERRALARRLVDGGLEQLVLGVGNSTLGSTPRATLRLLREWRRRRLEQLRACRLALRG